MRLIERTRSILGVKRAGETSRCPYATRCVCGESFRGYRESDSQVLTCPVCGASVFIFPRSPFPDPTPRSRKDRAPTKGRDRAQGSTAPIEPRTPLKQRVRHAGGRAVVAARNLVPPARWFTTPRVVALSVALVVLATGWWQIRRSTFRELRALVVPSARRGLLALGNGDFEKARNHLDESVRAMDRLGEPFPDEARYRQAHGESGIVVDLIPQTLETALSAARGFEELVSGNLRDHAIIIDAEVEPTPEGGWRIGYVTFIDGEPVPIHRDGLRLFERLGVGEKTRMIFGARVEAIVEDGAEGFVLKLAPDSGFLITEERIFGALGLAADPSAVEVRKRQKARLETQFGPGAETGE